MLIKETRQVAAGFGGTHWQERVTAHDGRTALPKGAKAADEAAVASDWKPMHPQPDDQGVLPGETTPPPAPPIPGADGVIGNPPEITEPEAAKE